MLPYMNCVHVPFNFLTYKFLSLWCAYCKLETWTTVITNYSGLSLVKAMFHLADWLNVLPLCYLMLNQLVDWVLKEVLYGPHLPIETSKMNKLYSFERLWSMKEDAGVTCTVGEISRLHVPFHVNKITVYSQITYIQCKVEHSAQ